MVVNMRVVLLAGGFGTRLNNVPKGLIKVDGKNILDYIYEQVRQLGVPIYLYSNVLYAKKYYDWVKDKNIEFYIVPDVLPHNSNGVWGNFMEFSYVFGIDDTLLVATDNYFDVDLRDFMNFKNNHNKIIVKYIEDKSLIVKRFGNVLFDPYTKRVIKFVEKPQTINDAISNYVATGIIYLNRETIKEYLPMYMSKGNIDSLGGFIQFLIDKVPVYAYEYYGEWYDVGNLEVINKIKKKHKVDFC